MKAKHSILSEYPGRYLPVGKLPPELLKRLLAQAEQFGAGPSQDRRVVLGPAPGLDCAVLDMGDNLLVLKSDPITFAVDQIGWYAVQVNANDIATTGAVPRWMLVTLLLPEEKTTSNMVEQIGDQLFRACAEIEVVLIGGHTEITAGLPRPILVGTMIGEVPRERLVTPRGARPGDRLLITKGVPIEATAILGREFSFRLAGDFTTEELHSAREFLYRPGISVLADARVALQAGEVHAMHDPTEGGLYTAVWELAEASSCRMLIDLSCIPVPELSQRICSKLDIDPFAAIASGALLMAVPPEDSPAICHALEAAGITCVEIGGIQEGIPGACMTTPEGFLPLPRPERDAIATLY